jgi:hypothetical protein
MIDNVLMILILLTVTSSSLILGDLDVPSSMISLKFLIDMAEDFCTSLSLAANLAMMLDPRNCIPGGAHVQGHRQIMTKE